MNSLVNHGMVGPPRLNEMAPVPHDTRIRSVTCGVFRALGGGRVFVDQVVRDTDSGAQDRGASGPGRRRGWNGWSSGAARPRRYRARRAFAYTGPHRVRYSTMGIMTVSVRAGCETGPVN